MTTKHTHKHEKVQAWLREAIADGRFAEGSRLPREIELMARFGVSRITVTRAMRDLQAAGLIERRVGAGSFVRRRREPSGGLSFGLLIPDLGVTDLFEPLCQGMMTSPLARDHVLVWGGGTSSRSDADRGRQLCDQFIARGMAGVFFAPLEFGHDHDRVNADILARLDRASIPVVLLDRTVTPYPDPGRHDLVALDNRHAAYVMTHHLLARGAARVAFVARRDAPSSVDAREAGYREAVERRGSGFRAAVYRVEGAIGDAVQAVMRGSQAPDGIVCANDRTAGEVAHALGQLGCRVPENVRLVGIDDVGYAELLPVPLTTFRQPVDALGDAALEVMLGRIARPERAPRHTLLHGRIVVRASCGG